MILMEVMLEKMMKEREKTEKIKRRKSVSEYEHDFKVWTLQVVNSKETNLNYLALYVCIGSMSNYGELRLSFHMK